MKVIYTFTCPSGHFVSGSKNYRAFGAIDAARRLPHLPCPACPPEKRYYADPVTVRLLFDELQEDWLHDAGETIEAEGVAFGR